MSLIAGGENGFFAIPSVEVANFGCKVLGSRTWNLQAVTSKPTMNKAWVAKERPALESSERLHEREDRLLEVFWKCGIPFSAGLATLKAGPPCLGGPSLGRRPGTPALESQPTPDKPYLAFLRRLCRN